MSRSVPVSLAVYALAAPLALAACTPAESTDPDPEPSKSAEYTAGPFPLESGQDKTLCTYVRSDADTEQDITAFVTEQSKGGHHLIVYTVDHAVDDPPFECPQGGQPSWSQVLATQLETETIRFPEGVGFHVKPHQQYVMETHFLNVTSEKLDVTSRFRVEYAEAGTVKERAATYFFGTMNIDVPAGASASKTAECHPPKPMTLHTMFGHQHRMGVGLTAMHRPGGEGGDPLYHSTDWEAPDIASFDGGIDVGVDDLIGVTCEWDNTGTSRLRYPHEMCYAIGYYWPAEAGVFCATGGGDDATCQCREQGGLDTGPGGSSVEISVRRAAEIAGAGDAVDSGAPIYCALFRAEDYGPFGPKAGAQPYYFRDIVDHPLTTEEDAAELAVHDVTPGDYAVSCVMDVIGGGFMPGSGDVANLTAPKVTLVKGETAKVDVTLDIAIP